MPKKNGGYRVILSPLEPLKSVQRQILRHVLCDLRISSAAHGFVGGRDIITNALPHLQSHSMLGLDLADAFGNVWLGWMAYRESPRKTTGLKLGLHLDTWQALLPFISYVDDDDGILPQGAPTSPAIFNAMCCRMDTMLLKLAKNVGGVYTRYADNLTFSMPGPSVGQKLINAILRIVDDDGFPLNDDKTQLLRSANNFNRPLRLPGLNIINGQLVLPADTLKRFRSAMYRAGQDSCSDDDEVRDHARRSRRGIKGYVIRIYGELPPQLRGMYEKGRIHASEET
ncbi:MAG: reverse transcriptase family protein [Patescibacteria group bacterium]|jgi:hypothetical protein